MTKSFSKIQFCTVKISNVIAELFYITANALYQFNDLYIQLSNFYINLAKYLNQIFFRTILCVAENFVHERKLSKSKKSNLILNIKLMENIMSWHSSKQIALNIR